VDSTSLWNLTPFTGKLANAGKLANVRLTLVVFARLSWSLLVRAVIVELIALMFAAHCNAWVDETTSRMHVVRTGTVTASVPSCSSPMGWESGTRVGLWQYLLHALVADAIGAIVGWPARARPIARLMPS